MSDDLFLPGVPGEACLEALGKSDGNELASGKLISAESSAALALNTFGWFLERPHDLPKLPDLLDLDWPAKHVAIERQMRFPWRGGRHPWLDAAAETERHLIGIESKRFEPFRDKKLVNFSDAYERQNWGEDMAAYDSLRRDLTGGTVTFGHLDAAQLIKHAYGLVTEGKRIGLRPVLYYIFDEPVERAGKAIDYLEHNAHRKEIAAFADKVRDQFVRFAACSYTQWLEKWPDELSGHADAVRNRFNISSNSPVACEDI